MTKPIKHGKYTEDNGRQSWYHHGMLHRTDGPAVVLPDGNEFWFQRDSLHRAGGPAFENKTTNEKSWYLYGEEYTKECHKHNVDLHKLTD